MLLHSRLQVNKRVPAAVAYFCFTGNRNKPWSAVWLRVGTDLVDDGLLRYTRQSRATSSPSPTPSRPGWHFSGDKVFGCACAQRDAGRNRPPAFNCRRPGEGPGQGWTAASPRTARFRAPLRCGHWRHFGSIRVCVRVASSSLLSWLVGDGVQAARRQRYARQSPKSRTPIFLELLRLITLLILAEYLVIFSVSSNVPEHVMEH